MHITWFGRGKVKLALLVFISVWFLATFADVLMVSNRVRLKQFNPRSVDIIFQDSDANNNANEKMEIDRWEKEQLERKGLINKVCRKYPDLRKKTSVGNMFIRDPKKNLVYCRHGKVGTTTWLGHFLTLSNITEPEFSRIADSSPLLHQIVPKIFKVRGRGEKLSKIISRAVSFSMVRHPFERLVSAYQDKIVNFIGEYKRLKSVIGAKFGEVNFTNFVKYVLSELSSGDIVDVHWRPFVSRCNYCNVDYTIIAKFETFGLDLDHISSMAGVKFSSKHDHQGGDTSLVTTKLFSQLPRRYGEQLYQVYKMDFEMFDYDPWKYLNLTMPMSL